MPDADPLFSQRDIFGSDHHSSDTNHTSLVFFLDLQMSAHPIEESHRLDLNEVGHLSAVVEQPNVVRDQRDRSATSPTRDWIESSNAHELSSRWVKSGVRRCLDIVIAAVALLALLPMMWLIAVFVRTSSPGPVVFRQRRSGRHRKAFTLYKFRSMRVEDLSGSAITVSGDPRITTVGAFLRRYKLDELPQFWNILIDDMSLVGPRPKLPHHEGLDLPYRPGITGMATLAFRNEEQILSVIPHHQLDEFYNGCIKPHKARLDLEYMRAATFWTDLTLLWLTIVSCFSSPTICRSKKGSLVSVYSLASEGAGTCGRCSHGEDRPLMRTGSKASL